MNKKLSLKELIKLAKGEGTDCCDKETNKKSCCTLKEVANCCGIDDNQKQGCCQ